MRPGQNKRMRGRNGGRKGPNPLTRTYESNGPDVKIRGTAQHVAEKYLQLARDAQSSGDPVMAESYLQHAEHYFRIIAAAQQAQQQQHAGYNRPQNEQADAEEPDEDESAGVIQDRFESPLERAQAILNQPQPTIPSQAAPFTEKQQQGDQGGEGGRGYQGRGRNPRQQRGHKNGRPQRGGQEPADSDDLPPASALPAFITGGKDPDAGVATGEAPNGSSAGPDAENKDAPDFHLRPRRRRRPARSSGGDETKNEGGQSAADEVPASE